MGQTLIDPGAITLEYAKNNPGGMANWADLWAEYERNNRDLFPMFVLHCFAGRRYEEIAPLLNLELETGRIKRQVDKVRDTLYQTCREKYPVAAGI